MSLSVVVIVVVVVVVVVVGRRGSRPEFMRPVFFPTLSRCVYIIPESRAVNRV
jgi:hypothetical protein